MPLAAMPSSSWIVLPAVAVGAVVLGSIALLAGGVDQVGFPLSAVCSLAVIAAAHRRARSVLRSEPDAAFGMAMAEAGIAPLLVAGIYTGHDSPLWVESSRDLHAYKQALQTLWLLPALGVPCCVWLVEALATNSLSLRSSLRPLLRTLSIVVAAAALWGLARGVVRPVLDPLPHGLPVVATLPAPNYLDPIQDHLVGPVVLTAACPAMRPEAQPCYVVLRRRESDPFPRDWSNGERLPAETGRHRLSAFSSEATLELLRDERHDLWITREHLAGHRRPFAAFRGRDLARVDVSMRDYASGYGPPRGWCFSALGGVALAWWLSRRGPRLEQAPEHGAMDATPEGDGALRLADGTVMAAPTHVLLPPGPVVVAMTAEGDGPYRGATGVRVLWEGTLAQWRQVTAAEVDVYRALALSTLVLAGTPMAAAAWLRLLG